MNENIATKHFTSNLLSLLEETFETHHGHYLDKGDSLFETLAGISAAEASIPVGGKCASLAAQVAHITFYLEVLERALHSKLVGNNDWGAIWRTVERVTADEWQAINAELAKTYRRVGAVMRAMQDWDNDDVIGAALAIVVHTAYHLGEVRQALCVVKTGR